MMTHTIVGAGDIYLQHQPSLLALWLVSGDDINLSSTAIVGPPKIDEVLSKSKESAD